MNFNNINLYLPKTVVIILMSVFCFLYIFLPPICSIATIKLLDLFLIFVIIGYAVTIGNWKLNFCYLRSFYGFIPFVIYFIAIMFFRINFCAFQEVYFSNLRFLVSTVFNLIIVLLFLHCLISMKLITFDDFMISLLIASWFEFILVGLAFFIPSARDCFNGLIIKYARNEAVIRATSETVLRSFGFADNLFDSFGYRFALLNVLFFINGILSKKKIYSYSAFILLLVPLLNARTGVLLSLVGFFIGSCYYIIHGMKINYIKLVVYLLIFISASIGVWFNLPNNLRDFLEVGLNVTVGLFVDLEVRGVYKQILCNDLVFPDNVILGAGGIPDSFGIMGLDNGFIKEIWSWGVIGCCLYLGGILFFWLFWYRKKYGNHMFKMLAVCFVCMFLLYNIKIFPVFFTGANFLFFAVPLFFENKLKYNTAKEVDYAK